MTRRRSFRIGGACGTPNVLGWPIIERATRAHMSGSLATPLLDAYIGNHRLPRLSGFAVGAANIDSSFDHVPPARARTALPRNFTVRDQPRLSRDVLASLRASLDKRPRLNAGALKGLEERRCAPAKKERGDQNFGPILTMEAGQRRTAWGNRRSRSLRVYCGLLRQSLISQCAGS